ncbi:MAG: UbiD family decarboxylase [Beijerinckiaceae bacterium]|jgi:UbiD family decarboxylase|nr:UbiD family decarboxylase [Beijerinckiaceae bacterium]
MDAIADGKSVPGDKDAPSRHPGDNQKGPKDLRDWLDLVEADGGLKRISAPVSMKEEMSALTLMVAQDENSPALLFEQVAEGDGEKVEGARVLSNMLGASRRRFALAAGIDPNLSTREMILAMRERGGRRIAPIQIDPADAPVNDIILTGDDIDLTKLPAPKFWPRDGGDYIGTGDITFTRDPATGRMNVGCYRQMVQGPRQVGMYCSPGKHGLQDREAWWARGEPCEVVAAYGIDPVPFMVAAQSYGVDTEELDIIGGLTGMPFELTSGVAGSLPIPARAEIVIEGTVSQGDVAMEGPLGEFTGYYGRPESAQPVIQVKALHMRHRPIMTAALMANYPACEIGAYYAIMRSAAIWDDLERFGIPGIKGVYAHPAAASGWGMVVVSFEQKYAGHTAQVLAAASQCPAAAYYTKWIIAVDDDVDPADMNQVVWAMSTRCSPVDDIDFQRKTWSTGLDPSQFTPELRAYGSKALIDACKPHRFIKEFPVRTLLRKSVYDEAVARWAELGLDGAPPVMGTFDGE